MHHIYTRLAQERQVRLAQVQATVQLLDEGASVPFIARYRKEATAGWTTSRCANSSSAWPTCARSNNGARRWRSRCSQTTCAICCWPRA